MSWKSRGKVGLKEVSERSVVVGMDLIKARWYLWPIELRKLVGKRRNRRLARWCWQGHKESDVGVEAKDVW
jgi:hypothetical protein